MKIYLSHSIRGPKRMDATHTDMKKNCDQAIQVGKLIRETFPSIDLYIPAEHEDFVLRAYDMKFLTEKQILDVDCSIIDSCNAVIILASVGERIQGGRLIEYNHAIKTNKPVLEFTIVKEAITWLSDLITKGR